MGKWYGYKFGLLSLNFVASSDIGSVRSDWFGLRTHEECSTLPLGLKLAIEWIYHISEFLFGIQVTFGVYTVFCGPFGLQCAELQLGFGLSRIGLRSNPSDFAPMCSVSSRTCAAEPYLCTRKSERFHEYFIDPNYCVDSAIWTQKCYNSSQPWFTPEGGKVGLGLGIPKSNPIRLNLPNMHSAQSSDPENPNLLPDHIPFGEHETQSLNSFFFLFFSGRLMIMHKLELSRWGCQ